MCDIWKANNVKKEISAETLKKHVSIFKKLAVREVVLSGGEALMHSNLWRLCALLRENKIQVTLLSTGLLLKKNAQKIIDNIHKVIVSIDGSEEVHDKVRNIPLGFSKLSEGVRALKELKADFPISGRCVLQRLNFFDMINIVRNAKQISLDKISFLTADVSSSAFNRPLQWSGERVGDIALTKDDVVEFEKIVLQSFVDLRREYDTGFITENKSKMNRMVQYYKAINQMSEYPRVVCNAPWVSAVIESDGSLLPCFFHKPYGNIYDNDFLEIINSKDAKKFRRNLSIHNDGICKKCVCSLKLGVHQMQ